MSSRTPEEQSKIAQQFREECIRDGILKPESEAANDERILLRFLRARQYNMEQSKLMMKNSEEWRASVGGGIGMEEFYKDDNNDPLNYPERSVVFQHWPLFFHKTDKKGRPVNIHKFGSINVPELMKVVTPERFVDILTANCEFLPREVLQACSKVAGKRIETVLVIVDLKGFGVSQFWAMKDFVRTSFQISQDYYPETMGQVAVINAPLTFTTMWSAIKPWLAKETVEKVDILGSNYQDALLKLVDADSLPKDLGGNCTCAEHGGDCATSNIGPWMDGRAERRKAWQRGERSKIAVDFGEEEAKKEAAEPLAAEKKTPLPHEDSGMSLAPDAPLEAAVVSALPPSAPGTPDSVAPPTPGRSASDVVEMRGPSSPGTEAPEAPLNASPDEVEQPEQAPLPPSSKQPEQAPLPLSSEQPVTSAEPAQDIQRASVDGTATPYSQASNRSHKSVKSHTSSRLTGLLHRKRPTSMASDHTSSGESSGETVVAEPRKSRFREVVDRVVDKISRQGVEK